ncbi:hypothetical protein Tco_0167161 [Tanacetum coccineum]
MSRQIITDVFLSNDRYVLYDPVIHPLSPHYESKIRKDYGTKRGLPSTSASSTSTFDHPSSSYHVDENDDENDKDGKGKRGRPSTSASSSFAFDHPSSSHHIDDDNDENDEGTSRASTPFPTRYVNSLTNEIPQVFSNPP